MKMFKTFLAVFFSILFSLFVVLNVFVFNISLFADKNNIKKNIKNIDLVKEVNKVRNSGSVDNESKINKTINEVYSVAKEYGVPERVVDEIINSDTTKNILGVSAGNFMDYIINGSDFSFLSVDEAYNLISKNVDKLINEVDIDISLGQKEKFLNRVKLELPDIIDSFPKKEDLLASSYGKRIKMFQKMFNKSVKIVLIVGLTFSMIMVFILKKIEAFNYLGIAMLLSGLILAIFSFLIPSLLISGLNQAELSIFAGSLIDYLSKDFLISSIAVITLSIISLLIFKFKYKVN